MTNIFTTALTITAPKANDAWDFSQTNTIEWSSVSTDPSNFSIVLVDNSNPSGPTQTTIKDLVNTADNKYSFTNVVAAPGDKYQIRFVGTTASNTGIVTQSENFNVTKSGTAPSSTSSSGPSPTGSQAPASSSTKPNGASALTATVGLAGSVVAALFMLL
ncbi:MAG: putative extracellular conserved serine-rich protein [Massilia sp.]|nr:putative extracellular conserved serine-rich protein [Massilia sp.]